MLPVESVSERGSAVCENADDDDFAGDGSLSNAFASVLSLETVTDAVSTVEASLDESPLGESTLFEVAACASGSNNSSMSLSSSAACKHIMSASSTPIRKKVAFAAKKMMSHRQQKTATAPSDVCKICAASALAATADGVICVECADFFCANDASVHYRSAGHRLYFSLQQANPVCLECDATTHVKIPAKKKKIFGEIAASLRSFASMLFGATTAATIATSKGAVKGGGGGESAELDERLPIAPPSGFNNLGNTCYLNSSLQALRSIPNLVAFLGDAVEHVSSDSPLATLYRLFASQTNDQAANGRRVRSSGAASSAAKCVDPSAFIKSFSHVWPCIKRRHQQDSHEFLAFLFHCFEAELAVAAEEALIQRYRRLFVGSMSVRISCDACGYASKHTEDFCCLSLPLIDACSSGISNDASSPRLEDLLADFQRPHCVEYACEKCSATHMQHQIALERLPHTLILHLKRFSATAHFSKRSASLCKDSMFVSFDGAMSVAASNSTSNLSIEGAKKQQNEPPLLQEQDYSLNAVIVHVGQAYDSGHYVCYVQKDGGWFATSDAAVKRIEFGRVAHAEAYILFYSNKGVDAAANYP